MTITQPARRVALLVLVLAVVLAVWFALPSPEPGGSAKREVAPPANAAATEVRLERPLGTSAAEPATTRAPVAAEPEVQLGLAHSPDDGSEPMDEETPDGDWIDVEVLFAADGRPAPEAEVVLLGLTAAGRMTVAAAVARGDSVDQLVRAMGTVHAVDATAKVRVPLATRENAALAALAEGHLALIEELDGNGPFVLQLQPVHTFRARVLDAGGAPLPGILVTLRVIDGDDRSDTFTSLSDSDGLVNLKVPDVMLQEVAAAFDGESDVQLALAARGLFLDPVEVELDPDAVGGEPLELRMPAHGWLRIERAPGSSSAGRLLTMVRPAGADRTWNPHLELETVIDEEPVRVGPVQLGLDVEVQATSASSLARWQVEAPGPAVAGETVSLVLTPEAVWTLRGRAVDEGGEILARAALRVGLQLESDVPDANHADFGLGIRVRCDADGYFALELPADLGRPTTVHFALRRQGVERTANVVLPLGDNEGWDMGELRLRAPSVGVEGQVVDPGGAPIAGATVTLYQLLSIEGERTHRRVSGTTRTQRDGSFQIPLPAGTGSLTIRVDAQHYLPLQRDVLAGENTGAIQLSKAGSIVGEVRFDADLPLTEFQVAAFVNGRMHSTSSIRPDGGFVLHGLPSAAVLVQVHHPQWLGARVGYSEPVDVVAGGSELRLEPLDVRGALHSSRVKALDENGDPLGIVLVEYMGAGPSAAWASNSADPTPASWLPHRVMSVKTDKAGAHRFWHLEGSHLGRVSSPDWSPKEVRFEGGLEVVQLAPLNDLTLVVRIPAGFPSDVELEVGLEQGNSARFANVSKPSVQLSLPEMEAGEHQLTFAVAREGAMVPVVLPAEQGRIRVAEFPTVQTIEVDLPAAVLARARELAEGG
ncbi:MAG: hypothetical protein GC161_04290 [Planctomycetaceae bacterium]|nr:hypothetical protein [Planctomycetaceae bacterium]